MIQTKVKTALPVFKKDESSDDEIIIVWNDYNTLTLIIREKESDEEWQKAKEKLWV